MMPLDPLVDFRGTEVSDGRLLGQLKRKAWP